MANTKDVEALVKRLYSPGSAMTIARINDQLQQLQLSQDGWRLANELMSSDDQHVRFFAALTFTVKLNNDGRSLDDETAREVQTRLIYWLVLLVRQGEGGLVCRKLCSTLTTYFIRSPLPWNKPLLHLASSFAHGNVVSESDVDKSGVSMSDLASSLSPLQLSAMHWFSAALAEEVGKTSTNTPAHAQLHSRMESIVVDASMLLGWSFRQPFDQNTFSSKKTALQTFLTWVNYAQPAWGRNHEALRHLRNLTGQAAECFVHKQLCAEAIEVFRDILESYTTFFQPPHMDLIANIISGYVRPNLLRALYDRESDGLHVAYGQFVIAFGCANIQQVVEEPNNALSSEAIVRLHIDMISAHGYPGDDDQLSILSIEFWNTYIEYVNDLLFSKEPDDPDPAWLPQAKYTMHQVVQLLWKKMHTPPTDVAQDWGEEERDSFKEFRLDAGELLLSTFLLLGKEMFQSFVNLSMTSLATKEWHGVEAALFCLNNLADNVLEDPKNGGDIGAIFSSSLFRDVADFSENVPSQARRTAIDTLSSYGQFIERRPEFLPDTVKFLFASLETPNLANTAARAIESLCSTCRASLTGELAGFLDQYQRLLSSTTIDPYAKVKVVGAIAAIIQALKPESAKAAPLLALLQHIENDVASAKDLAARGEVEAVEVLGVSALECLASIGKGLQVPEDLPIDIYDDDDDHAPKRENYWATAEGQVVQRRIMGCFSVLQVVGNYSAAIDAACQVLRTGYTELEPGPFVLPPSVTVEFVQQCSIDTPQLDLVLSAAWTLITQHSRQDSKRIDAEVKSIHGSIISFAQRLGESSNDPAIAARCIEILSRLMPYYAHVLFGEIAPSTLDFVNSAIMAPDPFPKRSACEFWTKMITPQTANVSEAVKQRIDEVMSAYGPKVATCLMFQLGGLAMRSDLDFLCDALKTFLLNQPNAQAWLQDALASNEFPGSNVSLDGRMTFFRQLIRVRGDFRKMKEVCQAFWASCRGTVVSYVS